MGQHCQAAITWTNGDKNMSVIRVNFGSDNGLPPIRRQAII